MPTPDRRRVPFLLRLVAWIGLAVAIAAYWAWAGGDPAVGLNSGVFASVGLAVAWRRPRQPIAWLLVLVAFGFVPLGSSVPATPEEFAAGRLPIAVAAQVWVSTWSPMIFFGALGGIAVVFPTGTLPAGRLGLVARIAIILPVLIAIGAAFAPELTISRDDGSSVVANPLAIAPDWAGWEAFGLYLFYPGTLGALLLAMITFLLRFRAARGIERTQSKWLLAAFGAVLAAVVFAFAMIVFVDSEGFWMWTPAVVAYPMVPVAIGMAVLRYRLYEIDRIVSRTISWALTTGLIGALFAGSIVALQALLASVTSENTLAVAASTLLAAAVFQPMRRRIQLAVDHRFNRRRYDAERIVEDFAGHLRGQTDLDQVRAGVNSAIAEALSPQASGLWLKNDTQIG